MIKKGKDLVAGDKIYHAKTGSCYVVNAIMEWTDAYCMAHLDDNLGVSYIRSDCSFGVVSQNNPIK